MYSYVVKDKNGDISWRANKGGFAFFMMENYPEIVKKYVDTEEAIFAPHRIEKEPDAE